MTHTPARSFRLRFILWIAIVGAIASGLIALAWSAATTGRMAVSQLASEGLGTVAHAREFREVVDDLHGALLRFGTVSAGESNTALEHGRAQLSAWLRAREAAAESAEERQLLARLDEEIAAYFRRLDALKIRPAGPLAPLAGADLVTFDDAAIRLQSLADDVSAYHVGKVSSLLDISRHSVARLRDLVIVCLVVVLASVVRFGWFFYRDYVRPMQARLVESEKAFARQEKLAALGTLAAGVAHEIRNPLTAVKARLFTLRKLVAGDPAMENLAAIHREIERLDAIVRDVLGYARPAEPALRDVELASWTGAFAAFLEADLTAHQIAMAVDAPEKVVARADPDQLHQIMLNLVRNAQEAFAGRPGRITLAVRRRRIAQRAGRPGERAVLSVTDDGPGIPVEIQDRLFDPFFTTKPSGTGLGLSIVARSVAMHHGDIVFQSAPGAGTRFEVLLPLGERPVSPPSA